jgi:glycolate oxidase iron-sulfur subunit
MQTALAPEFAQDPLAQQAQAHLRQCVHCGFCTAVCPTYQLTGDELDSPRGRIYLIKQVLEGNTPTQETQLHLDRCLTCRNCEVACPSGVEYGRLIDWGRTVVEQKVARPTSQAQQRKLMRIGLTSSKLAPLLKPAIRIAQTVRGVLPTTLQAQIPLRRSPGPWPQAVKGKPRAKVLVLAGCIEPALMPTITRATARVLAAADIEVIYARGQGCCGALREHLADPQGARAQMRANLNAWRPFLEGGDIDAIVSDASGCSLMLKDYGHLLADDPNYAKLAAKASTLARDLSEMLPVLVRAFKDRIKPSAQVFAYHPPCTLQHGQRLPGQVEKYLGQLGFKLRLAHDEVQMCCGAGGANAVLQPTIAAKLRTRKLDQLLWPEPEKPAAILSSNVVCLMHLQAGAEVPVRHWVEILDAALSQGTDGL